MKGKKIIINLQNANSKKYLHDLRVNKYLINRTQRALSIKEKLLMNWAPPRLRTSFYQNTPVKEPNASDRLKVFAIHVNHKGLISRIKNSLH